MAFKLSKNTWVANNGYRHIAIWVDNKRIQTPEHRFMMEKYLGRKLDRSEQVHHINGDKLDNRIKNLEVLSNRAHKWKHLGITQKDVDLVIERIKRGQSYSRAIKGTNIKSVGTVFNLRKEYGI